MKSAAAPRFPSLVCHTNPEVPRREREDRCGKADIGSFLNKVKYMASRKTGRRKMKECSKVTRGSCRREGKTDGTSQARKVIKKDKRKQKKKYDMLI